MKVYAVLLIAALCATAISAQQEPEQSRPSRQSVRDRLVAKAKELQVKLTQALTDAKAKGEEVAKEIAKVLGEKKEQAVARLHELQAQLKAKLKELREKYGPIVDKAKQQAAEKAKARIEKAIKELQAIKDKLDAAQ